MSLEQKALPQSGFGVNMPYMLYQKPTTLVILLVVCFNMCDPGLFGSLFLPGKAVPKTVSCPLHSANCCCPEICTRVKKPVAKKACHDLHSSAREAQRKAGSSSRPCFLKAGCGEKDPLVSSAFFLRDFLPQLRVTISRSMEVSFLSDLLPSLPLAGFSPKPFHPPKRPCRFA